MKSLILISPYKGEALNQFFSASIVVASQTIFYFLIYLYLTGVEINNDQ